MASERDGLWLGPLLAMLAVLPDTAAYAEEPAHASPWIAEQTASSRLIAGGAAMPGAPRRLFAGLEIALADGWKTYWRNPGASGVPPRIEIEGSDNVAAAELLFPAPERFTDKDGDTIGYKHKVVLPLAITPKDPGKPIALKVAAEFGICRDVCIPVQPTFDLGLPADAARAPGGAGLAAALARVPQPGAAGPGDPQLRSVKVELATGRPRISIEATFPGDKAKGDIFLEAPDGAWMPLPKPAGEAADGGRRFEVDLTDGVELADLKGKTIRMTLVGSGGQAEASFKLE